MKAKMDTEIFRIGEDAVDLVPGTFRELWGDAMRPVLVADENTWRVAGPRLQSALEASGLRPAGPFVFPAGAEIYADDATVAVVAAVLAGNDLAAVSLGSGTINDVVKRASFECGKQYVSVPTAPSVDGYTSFGAAISVGGFKKTLACPAPVAVIADSNILRNAPLPMIAAGYCDLLAKVPAGADWIIADAVGSQPIDPKAWSMVQDDLRSRVSFPAGIAARDMDAVDRLFSGLVEVGFAMQYMQDSRPASGAEHLFSHVWEMGHLAVAGQPVSHGFKVAIGSLVSTAMMTEMMKIDAEALPAIFGARPGKPWETRLADVEAALAGSGNLDATLRVCGEKHLEGESLRARRDRIAGSWDEVKSKVAGRIIPFGELKCMLNISGSPSEPAEIGLTREMTEYGIRVAQMIRTRYTVLDWLYETGVFDEVTRAVLDGGTYFSCYA